MKLLLGTRGSPLARTQSEGVAQALEAAHGGLSVELCIIRTTGDKVTDTPLSRIGGEGIFTKEIEQALLDRRIDFAVHSMKDMPTRLPDGLTIGCVPSRLAAFDCLVSLRPGGLDALPEHARVASGSLRRRAQLLNARPGLRMEDVRGNVATRLRKIADKSLDATVLAQAGLARLGVQGLEGADEIEFVVPESWDAALAGLRVWVSPLRPDICLPAVGQGALCIEARQKDGRVLDLLALLHDDITYAAVRCERSLLRALEGGCQVPIAAWARVGKDELHLLAAVTSLDGRQKVYAEGRGKCCDAEAVGLETAERLRAVGAGAILDDIRRTQPGARVSGN